MTARGRVDQVNSSPGRVPRLPVTGPAEIGVLGLRGDGDDDVRHRGGQDRSPRLRSLDVIEALRAEVIGSPIGRDDRLRSVRLRSASRT